VGSQTYEVTFLGKAGSTLLAEFDDCEVAIGPGTTTLRAELPDQAALTGLMQRITSLGLDVIDVSLVTLPSGSGPDFLLWQAAFVGHLGLGHRHGDAESAQDVPAG